MGIKRFGCGLLMTLVASISYAEPVNDIDQKKCMQEQVLNADPTTTAGEIENNCKTILAKTSSENTEHSAAQERHKKEAATEWNPFVITPYRSNYILPYSYYNAPVDSSDTEHQDLLDNEEIKLQISLKVPLTTDDLFTEDDGLYFAFTIKAFWQAYNSKISSPFRETNYQPELFYSMPLHDLFDDSYSTLDMGFEHESNGRSQLLSRSWNRLFLDYSFSRDNYLISFRPWYRIPEDDKTDPMQASGDDNPDIEKYMGHFELRGAWKYHNQEITMMLRNNLRSENYGAIELNYSFPLWGKLRGLVQYFNGYGESLIDYNHRIERIGIGFLLTNAI